MLAYLAAGAATLAALLLLARFLSRVSPSDLAQAARTFLAVFGTLAGGGLFLLGRYGLALAALAAAAMAIRALWKVRGGAEPLDREQKAETTSRVQTDLLEMELDRSTGRLEGRVRRGRFAGRDLALMPLEDLLALLDEARASDPPSVALLEAWLDRVAPDWRRTTGAAGTAPPSGPEAMDERTALAILGLEPGASAEEVQAAYRRLMAKLHPDHGGSSYLAAQLNRAREVLLRGRR
ncbi:MAG: DnaJ domain-containing protein [Geminicoccaceae bacterium]|nr:DnaJ domain-containing protein [Geminicoccaceae bacterium]